MFSRTARWALIPLLTVTLGPALWVEPAHAQCGGGSQQNRSQMQGRPQQNMTLATTRPQGGGPFLFTGLTAQQPLQNALFAAPQQQQQNAMLAALLQQQQQNAMLAAQQQQPQQQNAFRPVGQQPQGQQNVVRAALPQQQNVAAAQPRAVVPDVQDDPVPEDPQDVAARRVKLARALLSEARAADREGDRDLAQKLRDRAGDRLQQVVAKFPGTRASDEAQTLLDKMGL
jgi:delta 1-pyrroline-5-carboxylate dehydrogenase